MEKVLELELRQSEARQELSDLLESDPDSDKIGALTVEMRSLDRQIVAHKLAKPEPETRVVEGSPEGRELRQLVSKANVGEIFDAALERRNIDGATRELQEHYHLGPNQVPLDLLGGGQLETRAITPAPADVGQEQHAIVPYVFPTSVSAFLGIPQPRVGVGEAVYSVLTSTLAVGTPAEGAAQAETTGAFSADVLSPSRIQASYFYSREDSARFMGMDEALRANLSEGLQDGLDKAIVAGTNGLLAGTNLDANPVAAADTFASYVNNFGYSRVDGRYADTAMALRSVVGAATYAHMASNYRAAGTDRTALDRLMEVTGGVRVSAHVPAAASSKQQGLVRLGMRMDAISPLWEGISLIPDSITGSKEGTIAITAVMLFAVKILRKGGFHKQEVQIA